MHILPSTYYIFLALKREGELTQQSLERNLTHIPERPQWGMSAPQGKGSLSTAMLPKPAVLVEYFDYSE